MHSPYYMSIIKGVVKSVFKAILSALTIIGALIPLVQAAHDGYNWFANADRPQLTWVVHPVRSVIADPTRTRNLRFLLNNKPLDMPVYMARILIYNAGHHTIKANEFVHQKPWIAVAPLCTVIDAVVEPNKTLGPTGFAIDTTRLAKREIPLDWTLLEENDGAWVDIIYANKGPVPNIVVAGSLEGERDLLRAGVDFASRVQELRARAAGRILPVFIIELVLLGWFLYGIFTRNRKAWISCGILFLVEGTVFAFWLAAGPKFPLPF